MLRIAGERIATPVCALVRNDMVFDVQSTDFGAAGFQVFMSLRGGAKPRRGNPHPWHPSGCHRSIER